MAEKVVFKSRKKYLLESWGIIDTITSHSSNIAVLLKIFDNFRLVRGLNTGKKSSMKTGLFLLGSCEIIKLATSERFSIGTLSFGKDSNFAADCLSRGLETVIRDL